MTAFDAGIATIFLRFILMMAIIIAAGFAGAWWLGLIALPVFISAICGMKFQHQAS